MTHSCPNILIFHCDQLRYDALGCTGHPGNPTPNIDALAEQALVFTRHFVANPVCMPSRSSFFTGLPVTAHGVWGNGVPLNRHEYLPFASFDGNPTKRGVPELPTLADLLAENGYATGAFGKVHLTPSVDVPDMAFPESGRRWASGEQDAWHGPYFGFQHVDLTHAHAECPGGHYEAWLRDTHPELYERVLQNQKEAERLVPGLDDLHPSILTYDTHPSPWIGRQALAWIEAQDSPFCAFLGFPDPHHAFCALQEDIDYFDGVEMVPPVDADGSARPDLDGLGMDVRHFTPAQHDQVRRTTAAMVRTIDRAVGEVIDGLKAAGKWEHTIVLFTSDHGDYLGDHGRLRKSCSAANQLLHVPCILRLPGDPLVSSPCLHDATSNTDILPTLLTLSGAEVPAHVQGTDLLTSQPQPRYAIAHGFNGHHEGANFSIMDGRFRYTVYPSTGYTELFDHTGDLPECCNLADGPEFAADQERLHAALAEAQLKAVNPVSGRLASW